MRILIADDHSIFRKGLKLVLLEEFPFAIIEEATNAEDVIEKTLTGEWDFITCDLSMPGRNGLEIVKHIKQNFPAIPVLVLSMHPEHQFGIQSLRTGAAGYLNKNAVTEELITAVKRILQGRKYVSAAVGEKLIEELEKNNTDKLPHELLTDREFDVFKILAEGKSVSEIAEQLALSSSTLRTHRSRILTKLNMKTNVELTRYAFENKLV